MSFLEAFGSAAGGYAEGRRDREYLELQQEYLEEAKRRQRMEEAEAERRRDMESQERQLLDQATGVRRGHGTTRVDMPELEAPDSVFSGTALDPTREREDRHFGMGASPMPERVPLDAPRADEVSTQAMGIPSREETPVHFGEAWAYQDPGLAEPSEDQLARERFLRAKDRAMEKYPEYGMLIELAETPEDLREVLGDRVDAFLTPYEKSRIGSQEALANQRNRPRPGGAGGQMTLAQALDYVRGTYANVDENGNWDGTYRISPNEILQRARNIARGGELPEEQPQSGPPGLPQGSLFNLNPTSFSDMLGQGQGGTAPPPDAGPSRELAEAREIVQGLDPEVARQLLMEMGYDPETEIPLILGG